MLDYVPSFAQQSFIGEIWGKTVAIESVTYPNAIYWTKMHFDKYIHHLCSDGSFKETERSHNTVRVSLKYTVHISVLWFQLYI